MRLSFLVGNFIPQPPEATAQPPCVPSIFNLSPSTTSLNSQLSVPHPPTTTLSTAPQAPMSPHVAPVSLRGLSGAGRPRPPRAQQAAATSPQWHLQKPSSRARHPPSLRLPRRARPLSASGVSNCSCPSLPLPSCPEDNPNRWACAAWVALFVTTPPPLPVAQTPSQLSSGYMTW